MAGALVRLTDHASLSRETVRRRLAENDLKPWRKDMWCIPQVDAEYVARMENVLDLYAEAPDPKHPVVCFDESPTQLIGEVREPIRARSGQIERYDCEYKRNGTANLFVFLDAHRPWRKVKVTDSRTAIDFAICMRELTDVDFPTAERIRVVVDNLSTHSAGALYQAFPACEARRVLRRLEFHYVPKHASWLNMVEIEIGVLRGQCLDRRIATRAQLVAEIAAWERQRNASGARIKWMFTTEKARAKMGRAYPQPAATKVKSAGLVACLKNIYGYQNDSVVPVVAMPMHRRSWFRSRITGMEGFRRAILANDGVGSLNEVDHARPLLMVMETNMAPWFNGEHTQAQLETGRPRKLGT